MSMPRVTHRAGSSHTPILEFANPAPSFEEIQKRKQDTCVSDVCGSLRRLARTFLLLEHVVHLIVGISISRGVIVSLAP
jgi:hypothetical protein